MAEPPLIEEGDGGANEALLYALIRHQIMMLRVSEELRMRIQRILDDTEADIADKIRSRLLGNTGLQTGADVKRLETLLRIIRNIRTGAWEQVTETWVDEAVAIAQAEPALTSAMVKTVSPVVLDLLLPTVEQLKAIATSEPFQGRTLKQWASSLAQDDLRRIEAQIRMGMIAGEGSAAIARRVVGSAKLKGTDGVTQITRREAEAITRTAVNHISNMARRAFINANSDLFSEEQYVATLDARTTPVCRSNDGKRFKVGTGPIPPLHFNCRSLRVPVIDGDALGSRPFVASTRKQLLSEYAQKAGIKTPASRDDLPLGHKGKFDAFARTRIRELTGRVPGKTTYQEWLSTQPKAFQDDVLGPTRAKLFREGGLTLDKFVNQAGSELTLDQLARLHAEAFRAAGLDPEGFFD